VLEYSSIRYIGLLNKYLNDYSLEIEENNILYYIGVLIPYFMFLVLTISTINDNVKTKLYRR